MSKNYKNIKEYKDSWYSLTPNRLVMTLGPLKGEVNCDVCVVGAGFAGLSAALEMTQRGLSVVVIEASSIAAGASGRNSAHLRRGLGQSPTSMIKELGLQDARFMANLSLEGMALVLERMKKYDIQCDLKFGHLTAALKKSQAEKLKRHTDDWAKLGHGDLGFVGQKEIEGMVRTKKYVGGAFDPKGAHFHPLNYAMGLAHAVQKNGGKIYDLCPADKIVHGPSPKVITRQGIVNAKFVVLTNAGHIEGAEKISVASLPVVAHMIATEAMGEARARNTLQKDIAVTHAGHYPHYYSFSSDNRLLFGGNISYAGVDYPGEDASLRARMLQIFPYMKMTLIQHCWTVPLNVTKSRLPHIGRLSPTVYYAHGFGSNAVISTNVAGKILGEAVAGQISRFDVFDRLDHKPFSGGGPFRRPLFAMNMLWYRIRDML